ncbi:hypothetical protein AVEN_136058-1 [Araneus ventricosus]|uniref:Uncharacterized protein n=1 Tax=Araneus ventricosus TaxID=182803 RepID=A0A4Y2PJJ1_ARAVE|nr:hypothetical protein AVEN_136058-1 [Araneus ventricosus]
MRFTAVSDRNTKEKTIVVRITAKIKRYERVSAVAVAMMRRGKWSTKDYEILAKWFKLRREKEKRRVFHCWSKGIDSRLNGITLSRLRITLDDPSKKETQTAAVGMCGKTALFSTLPTVLDSSSQTPVRLF